MRTSKPAFSLVALAVAAGAALFFWERGSSPGRAAIETPDPARSGVETASLVPPEAAEVERTPLGSGEIVPAAEDSIPLVVIEASSGDPVAGAEVWAASEDEGFWIAMRRPPGEDAPDPEAVLQRVGRRYVANERGEVSLPSVDGRFQVCARRGELFGESSDYQLEARGGQLRLFPDRALVIRAVDPGGTPRPDVLVALDELTPHWRRRLWSARTSSPGGEARLPHVLDSIDDLRDQGLGEGEVFATFGFPLADAPRVSVDLGDPPAAPIRLVLPPTGTVAVSIEREDGRPLERAPLGRLRRAERESAPSGVYGSRFLDQEFLANDGRALFPFVGLGLELEVESHGPRDCEPVTQRFSGPTLPGEQVEIVLRHPLAKRLTLVGRVLRADGTPVANADLTFVTREAPRNPRLDEPSDYDWEDRETDGEGRFELVLEPSEAETLTLFVQEFAGSRVILETEAALSTPTTPGRYDLGDLLLEPAPLIAAGRVVDTEGHPLRATVRLKRKEFEDLTGEDWFWDLFGSFRDCTNEGGRFEVRGTLEDGEFALDVTSPDHWEESAIPVSPGATDLRIELRQQVIQYLRGSVILDEGIPGDLLVVRAQRLPAGDEWPFEIPFQDRAHFSTSIVPGTYEVSLSLLGRVLLHGPVVVSIESDELNEPPALQEIDLRGRLHPLRLRVENEAGRGLDGWVSVARPDGARRAFGQPIGEGDLQLVSPWPASDLLVSAPGYRSVKVKGATEECRVTLRRGIPLRLALNRAVELPEDCHLELRLSRSDEDPWDLPFYERRIGAWIEDVVPARVEKSELELLLPAPGAWKLVWLLDWRTEDDRNSALLEAPECVLVIEDRLDDQRFELDPPSQAALDAALAELRR